MSNGNLNETAPTRFQDIGSVSLAYRHFGKKGVPPVVCFQHFTGTMNNFDPIHTNRLAQDRPVILVDYRVSVVRGARCRIRSPLSRPTSSSSLRRSA
jgi:pimeloyl-ACP methyl ester carboxylesterase